MRIPVTCAVVILYLSIQAQVINTHAGTGTPGFSGDGGPATLAKLNNPYGVAMDRSGNLYVADANNNKIRKITSAGIISTVAGNGGGGFSGDGGSAMFAMLNGPCAVAVDSAGNIYIADNSNLRIRKVDPSGIITTYAGNGGWGYTGDGGPATAATFKGPTDVAIDKWGNVYISDGNDFCIRKVSSSGIITTVAGNGISGYTGDGGLATNAELAAPSGIEVDDKGNLYIADNGVSVIRKVDANGVISTIAGTGTPGYNGDGIPAVTAQLRNPTELRIDRFGNIYFAEIWGQRIRKIDTLGIISTVAGSGIQGFGGDGGPAISAQLKQPTSIALDAAGCRFFITDSQNHRVRVVNYTPINLSTYFPGKCSNIASVTLTVSGADNYTWTPASSLNFSNNDTVVSSVPSTTSYMIIASRDFCVDTIIDTLRVHSIPSITVSSNTLCVGSSATLSATGASAYTWTPSSSLSSNIGASVNASPSVTTTYSVTDNNSCTNSTTITLFSPPAVTLSSVFPSCIPSCPVFTVVSSPSANTYDWNFGNGITLTTTNTVAPVTASSCYSLSGTFVAEVKAKDMNGCVGIATSSVLVYPNPNVDFDYGPQPITILDPKVQFVNLSTDTISGYSWNFGDSNTSTDTSTGVNPTYVYSNEGTYSVSLTATSNHGCSTIVTKPIIINEYVIYVPNVFTPNGDGVNDLFFIKGAKLSEFNCKLFDRWGILVAEFSDLSGSWDGKDKKGSPCVDGVYYYIISYKTERNGSVNTNGFVQLIR